MVEVASVFAGSGAGVLSFVVIGALLPYGAVEALADYIPFHIDSIFYVLKTVSHYCLRQSR